MKMELKLPKGYDFIQFWFPTGPRIDSLQTNIQNVVHPSSVLQTILERGICFKARGGERDEVAE